MPASSKTTATLVGNTPSKQAPKRERIHKPQPIQNRVKVLLVHIPKFSIQGQARLATEVGVSRSTISRLVHGRINPSYRLARGVTDVLERMLGKPLDMRDVFSTDGTYLTPSGCALCRCHGCLPDRAWEEDGHLKPGWEDARPGDWSLAHAGTLEPVNEEDANGGFSGYGEAEDDDEEVLAEHWAAKLKSAKLKEAPRSDR
jgi:DNA-binding XRE family transcriptional regulator